MIRYWLIALSAFLFVLYLASLNIFAFGKPTVPKYQPWMEVSADFEFSQYREGIKADKVQLFKSMIDNGTIDNISYFNIKNNVLNSFCKNDRFQRACNTMASKVTELLATNPIPDLTFFISFDYSSDPIVKYDLDFIPPPILVPARNKTSSHVKNYILFVDVDTVNQSFFSYKRDWEQVYSEVQAANKHYPWDKKVSKAVWRGLPTDVSNYRGLSPRSKLVALSSLYDDILDAKFSEMSFFNSVFQGPLRPILQQFGVPPFMSINQQISYRIQINVDGVSASYPGFLWRLLSSSVTVKQQSNNEQWFYHLFLPWQHYIPVADSFINLRDVLNWILDHESEAQAIADLSTKTVEENLTPAHIDGYILTILRKYADLYNLGNMTH